MGKGKQQQKAKSIVIGERGLTKKDVCENCNKILENRMSCPCSAFYCDAYCQRQHWPEHRKTCTYVSKRQASQDVKGRQSKTVESETQSRATILEAEEIGNVKRKSKQQNTSRTEEDLSCQQNTINNKNIAEREQQLKQKEEADIDELRCSNSVPGHSESDSPTATPTAKSGSLYTAENGFLQQQREKKRLTELKITQQDEIEEITKTECDHRQKAEAEQETDGNQLCEMFYKNKEAILDNQSCKQREEQRHEEEQKELEEEQKQQQQLLEEERKQQLLEEERKQQQLLEEERKQQQLLEEERKQQLLEEERKQQQLLEEERKQQQLLEEERKQQQLLEEERKQQQLLEEERKQQQLLEEERKQQLLEEERKQQQLLEEERKQQQLLEEERKQQQLLEDERKQLQSGESQERSLILNDESDCRRALELDVLIPSLIQQERRTREIYSATFLRESGQLQLRCKRGFKQLLEDILRRQ